MVIAKQKNHQQGFGVQPATREAIAEPEPEAQGDRANGNGCDEFVEAARHAEQTLVFGRLLVGHGGQIHKNTRQVEKAGKPADDQNDVKGFNRQHG